MWVTPSWTTVVIVGYIGVVIFFITVVRKLLLGPHQKQKYLSAAEKETLIRAKEILRHSGALTIVLGSLAFAVVLYLEGSLPGSYLHFFILAAVYMVLYYADITNREKTSRAPPLRIVERHEELRLLTKTFKKVLDVNAVLLLIACVVYTRANFVPFHDIWPLLPWALTIVTAYGSIFCSDFIWSSSRDISVWIDLRKSRYRRVVQGLYLIMSWALAFLMLNLG